MAGEESPEEVAARLRQKIRNQALELLNKCDSVGTSPSSSKHVVSPNKAAAAGLRTPKTDNDDSETTETDHDDENDENTDHHHLLTAEEKKENAPGVGSNGAVGVGVGGSPKNQQQNSGSGGSSNELTKRLQKLALERQKLSSKDRLRVIQSDTSSHLSSAKTFEDMKLPAQLLTAIYNMGFDRPSAIQEEALPRILANPPRNLIGQAQSGSGKTATFTLGMLYRVAIRPNEKVAVPQALCVTPTRELAIQIVEKAVKPMSANMSGIKIVTAIAGEKLASGGGGNSNKGKGGGGGGSKTVLDAHVVVGTPGKIVDWIKRKVLNPKTIKVFVLDEADHMVAEGVHRANSLLIKKSVPQSCQCLLFSATFPTDVIHFATKIVKNPDKILIEDGPEFLVLDEIKQLWVDTRTYQGGKLEFLADIYSLLTIGQSIVFVGSRHTADEVHDTLQASGFSCSVLHSAMDASERDATMKDFHGNKANVLITTNVLARGVDVDNVCLVVNYDVPVDKDKRADYETYLHRIGRTGRFGRKGTAINFVGSPTDIEVLSAIERHFSNGGKEMIAQAGADPEALAELIEI